MMEETKNPQEVVMNAIETKSIAATEAAVEQSAAAIETKAAEINEALETKASVEDVAKLNKSIEELKEMSTKTMTTKKTNAYGEFIKAATNGITETVKKGYGTFDLNLKDFVAANGDDNYQVYQETRMDAIQYDPNYNNRLRNVLPSGSTNGGAVRYNIESAETDSAGAKAKGAAQTQSSVTLKNVHEPVKTLANVLTLPQEWLDDTAMIESYLSQRLIGNLMDVEDNQILKGNGSGANYSGLQNQDRAAFADAAARETFLGSLADSFDAADNVNHYDVLVALQAAMAADGNFKADTVIINPLDYAQLLLAKDGNHQYAIQQIVPQAGTVENFFAGMRIISHPEQTSGTFTILDSRYVTYWMREGITFSFGYNDDDFASNDITARAIQRGAVTVTRPNAVITDTFDAFKTALLSN